MKRKILSLILAMMMLVTLAVPMAFAEGDEAAPVTKVVTRNVAQNKYVYSGGPNAGTNAQKLTNGVYFDGIYAGGAGPAEGGELPSGNKGPAVTGQQNDWFIIDLGRQYKIKEVKLYSRWSDTYEEGETVGGSQIVAMQYVEVQGSNTETFDSFDKFIDYEGTITWDMVPCAKKTVENIKPYRYIRIQKTGNSYYGFSEIEVFADVVTTEISRNKPVSANVALDAYQPEQAVDGLVKENNGWLAEESKGASPYWMILDLEKEYPVSWIEMVGRVIGASENPATRYNWKVFGSATAPDESALATDTQSAGELIIPEVTASNVASLFPPQVQGQLSMATYNEAEKTRYITFYKYLYNVALSEVRAFVINPEIYDLVRDDKGITVSFSDTMNIEAVKKSISLKNSDGELIDISENLTVTADKAVIQGLTLEDKKEYVLTITTGAENMHGVGLAEDFKYEFDTYGTPSEVPYTKTVNKNVAQNKYVYTNSGNAGAKAQILTDGRTNILNPATYCADNRVVSNETANDLSGVLPGVAEKLPAASEDIFEWYIIDLGRPYKITGAELYSVTPATDVVTTVLRYMSHVEIQASNTIDFAEYETIMEIEEATADNFPYTASVCEAPKYYRYVRLQKNSRDEYGWSEVKIFADINMTEVSRGKEATASETTYASLPASLTTDGAEGDSWLVESATAEKYLSVDLGKELPVSWIEMVARVTGGADNVAVRYNWTVYGSKDAPTLENVKNGTQLSPTIIQGNASGTVNELFPKQIDGYFSMPIYQNASGQKFRYINFYKSALNVALSEVRAFVTAPEIIGAYATEEGIAVEFSEAMNPETINKGSIKLYDSEGNRVPWTGGTLSGNIYTIKGAALEGGAVYTVEVNNLAENTLGVSVAPVNEIAFKNTEDVEITGFEFVDSEGTAITDETLSKAADDVFVKLAVKANAKPADITLAVAFYEGSRLAGVDFKKVNVKAGVSDLITVSGAWAEETAYTKVKAFLWDGNFAPNEEALEIEVK